VIASVVTGTNGVPGSKRTSRLSAASAGPAVRRWFYFSLSQTLWHHPLDGLGRMLAKDLHKLLGDDFVFARLQHERVHA
jgi:hypothetical protein